MSYRTRSHRSSRTPIERIFEEVVGRRMTSEERARFHLKPMNSAAHEVSRNGASSGHTRRPKPN
jgi:hypothetical protein